MRKYLIPALIALFPSPGVQAQMEWPDGKKAAIVLTYDDGLLSQRNIVVPQLNKAGLKGTFYLYGQTLSPQDIPEWKEISLTGHELGNHSLFHPCMEKGAPAYPCFSLECYTVETMLREIAVMNGFLYAIDGDTIRTYAYPCGQAEAGGEDYSAPLGASGTVRYARRGGGGNPLITDFDNLDIYNVPLLAAQKGESAERLIDFVKTVVEHQGMGVLLFHGVGGDYLDVSAEVHQELVDYLAKNAADIWVVPFMEAMDYVVRKRTDN
jgi:peptidoglycan/xylan/chitin deacetylase (PgdA/CDA1 family)